MRLSAFFLIFVCLILPVNASCESEAEPSPHFSTEEQAAPQQKPEADTHGVGHTIFMYLPNRLLDVIDIFRLRVRVGPGLAVGARVTEPVSAYLGTYGAVYVGLPGPRLRPMPKSPIGLESYNGVSLSVLSATADAGVGPDYSNSEIGVGVQAAIVGFDIGIDPVEIVDLFLGLFTVDLRQDDL